MKQNRTYNLSCSLSCGYGCRKAMWLPIVGDVRRAAAERTGFLLHGDNHVG